VSVLVLGLNGCLGFPQFLYAKVPATKIGLRHFLLVWFFMLQRVPRFSFLPFSTTSSLIPSCAFFQSVCLSFAIVLFLFFAVLFRGAFHQEGPFPALLSDPLFSYLVMKPLADSSRFRLEGGVCGVISDFVNFPLSRSSPSCLPTFLKISIHSSLGANETWDRRRNISCASLLSIRTLNAMPESPALMLRFSRRSR